MAYFYQIGFDIHTDDMNELAIGGSLERTLGYLRTLLPSEPGYITIRAARSIDVNDHVHLQVESEWETWQELDQHRAVSGQLVRVFHRRGPAFVRPAWKRLAEMAGEDHVRDLVRQYGIENPLPRTLNVHLPTERPAVVEHEAGGAPGAILLPNRRRDWAGRAPWRQLFPQPLDGQFAAESLASVADLARQLRR